MASSSQKRVRHYGATDGGDKYAEPREAKKPLKPTYGSQMKEAVSSLLSLKSHRYYKNQEKLIQGFKDDKQDVEEPDSDAEEKRSKRDAIVSKIALAINLFLLLIKIGAAIISGSYAIMASVVDSGVDAAAGFVIVVTNEIIARTNKYDYPRGRSRLEPLAIIMISIIMALASLMMIIESLEAIFENKVHPKVEVVTMSIMGLTILLNFLIAVVCYAYKSPSTLVLAQDCRNDCFSNLVSIICAVIGYRLWKYADPLGAIVISLYILGTWFSTAVTQVRMLCGRTASPEFISRIVKLCVEHSDKITKIDTVLVYHWGTNYLVEVEVVMKKFVTLEEAHDTTQPLKHKIEALQYVERCFLHVDYKDDD